MTSLIWVPLWLYLVELVIKIVALGTVPSNRRPSSSLAWLLLIFFLPLLGVVIFLLIGSPFVRGRRAKVQAQADQLVIERMADVPDVPSGALVPHGVEGMVTLNRRLTALPGALGISHGLNGDYRAAIGQMTEAINLAKERVHAEFFIMAWDDEVTDEFFKALVNAAARGVRVRVLYDHVATKRYPGFKQMNERLTAAGIEWHQMLPIKPLKGEWRRPDLRNHRKLLVIDSSTGFMGSQNLIAPSYLLPANIEIGREWKDLNIKLTGEIVTSLEMVFALDWYIETGERLADEQVPTGGHVAGGEAMQLIPSGPGYLTMPNLRLFTALVYRAQNKLSLTSPYFVPDESLMDAITTAAYRGVAVELFVCEEADQFMVGHAQASFYRALLEAGVRIYLYPKPAVLHAKHFTVDDVVGIIGSSNMDYRSFGLDFEISLMGTGADFVADLEAVADDYRSVCRELTLDEWVARPRSQRYVDNVMRLLSALQ